DALGPLQTDSGGDGRGTAASASALLRATREILGRLEEHGGAPADPDSRGHRQLAHRILEAAGTRSVRLAFHATPFAAEWTELLLRTVEASDWSTGRLFFARARAHGDRTLFLLARNRSEGRISWAQAEERVTELGRALLGLQARDPAAGPVALLGQNSPELALLDLACLVTGTPNVPVPANSPPDQIDYILRHSNASVLFVGDDELAEQARISAPPPNLRSVHWLDGRREEQGVIHTLADFLALGDDVPPESVRRAAANVRCRDLATTMYTSGTTGVPKGVPFTHGNLVTKRFARAAAWPEIGAGDVFLCYLPLYHTFGRWLEMLGCVFWGSVYAFVEDASIGSLLYSFQRVRPTTFISVPRKWIQIAEAVAPVDDDVPRSADEDAELARALVQQTGGRLRRGLSAAGYLPPVVFRRFLAAGIELHSGFGMTEATGGITMTPSGDYRDDSIGTALPGIELKVADDGELLIRGYYVTPPAEGEPARDDGWFATGDIVRTDPDGHLRIVDRKKEIFKNVQGETISPRRIENLFAEFDVVSRAIVVGDRRPFCTVLLVPSEDLRRDFAPTAGEATIDNHELRDLIAPAVEAVNRFLAPFERILDFTLLAEDLDPETELTAKGTPKRAVVTERLEEAIEAMYARDQVSARVGDVDVRIPQWFLRYSGIPTREIRAEDGVLVAAGRRLTVRRNDDGTITVGDADYDPGGQSLLLGEIVGRAKLWLGNDAVRRFAGSGIDHWWRRGRRFHVRTRMVRRTARPNAPDPPESLPSQPTVASLHATAGALAHPDPEKRKQAALRLRDALENADRDLETVLRELLLSSLDDAEVRTDALYGLI
ncbi:MAG TPA: AMP-binding protein, partial [bacterium]|nr:AMP-binding protein [bacterium]